MSARLPDPTRRTRIDARHSGEGELLVRSATELQEVAILAQRQQAALRIDAQFGACVHDVEVAHGELADTVGW